MSSSKTVESVIAGHHAAGLDARYDDVLTIKWADDADRASILAGPAYDYRAQQWTTGDHAHYSTSVVDLPLLYCGADLHTCMAGTVTD